MRYRRPALMVVAVLVVGAGVWRATQGTTAQGAPLPATTAVPVTAGTAQAQTVPIYAQGLGTVQAISSVDVKSRVDGQIMKVFFTQGQAVKEGDPLFLIDPRPFQAALAQAQANQKKDQAQLAGAQVDLQRYGKLVGSGYQTQQSYDDQKATVAGLQAAVAADQAAIETAQLNLQYTVIRAPITGRTGALLVDQGNYVQASAGTNLVGITQIRPIYVSFTLPGNLFDDIRQGQAQHPLAVEAYAQDGKTRLARGTLSFIDNHIDSSTGTIALKGTFANADERLWPGAFVTVRLILGTRPNAVTVPAQTVMAGPDGDYVYIIRPDDTVQRQDVQLAARQDGIAVIAKGLTAGQRVVVEGQYRLSNNARVRIETAGRKAG